MSKTGISNSLRFAIIATQLLFLCACTIPSNRTSQPVPDKQTTPQKNTSPGGNEGGPVLKEQRVIEPSQGIDKEGLLVSYSMKAIPDETGYLLQLSLVFRNMSAKSITVTPKVVLLDAKGANIEAYTKKSFDKAAARVAAKAKRQAVSAKANNDNVDAVQEQLEWDKAFWLKKSFKIPAGGIHIGGLVFHGANLNVPMKLLVSSEGREFQFIIKGPISGKEFQFLIREPIALTVK